MERGSAIGAVVVTTVFVAFAAPISAMANLAALGNDEVGDLARDAVCAGQRRLDVWLDDLDFDDLVPRNDTPSTGKFVFRTR